jgi:hypothetical protein
MAFFELWGCLLRFTAKWSKKVAGGQRIATTGSCENLKKHPETGARIAISVIPSG